MVLSFDSSWNQKNIENFQIDYPYLSGTEVANEGEPEVEMENVSSNDSQEAEDEEAKTTEEKVEEDEDENELEEDEKELEDEGEEEDVQDEGKDSREDGEFAFPDTSIDLQHVTGTRYMHLIH